MNNRLNRRQFLGAAAFAAAGAAVRGFSQVPAKEAAAPVYSTKLFKAMIAGVADDATCAKIAAAGFQGVELTNKTITVQQAAANRLIAEKHGVRIHSYMAGWAEFNHSDTAKRRESIDSVRQMLRLASASGASTILLVPCAARGIKIPKPSEFKIDFDPGTLMVSKVVDGDNAPYADYIKAQNDATRLSIEAVNELIPAAAEEGVTICLENVWNNLWVLPEFASALVRSFNSVWVKAYLDLGNHVRYAPTEQWLEALRGITAKLHIKDFLLDRAKNNDGSFVPIGKGSINWRSVRDTIEKVRYNGWVSVESTGYTDAQHAEICERFFAGRPVID
ncbi:MAG: sugar phosphate isomerase/epimerase [Kiritimatiellae bacterium]|nr:sugar phosphate isomerase/epimerase [Kiritimatiellia bacterium]